jgi:hypothetical protein
MTALQALGTALYLLDNMLPIRVGFVLTSAALVAEGPSIVFSAAVTKKKLPAVPLSGPATGEQVAALVLMAEHSVEGCVRGGHKRFPFLAPSPSHRASLLPPPPFPHGTLVLPFSMALVSYVSQSRCPSPFSCLFHLRALQHGLGSGGAGSAVLGAISQRLPQGPMTVEDAVELYAKTVSELTGASSA